MPVHLQVELSASPGLRYNGRDVHGAMLQLINQLDPVLAQRLHDGESKRGWSVHRAAQTKRTLSLQAGFILEPDSLAIQQSLRRLRSIEDLRLGPNVLPVKTMRFALPEPGRIACAELGARFTLTEKLRLRILTPLYFRDGDKDFPDVSRLLPTPKRIFHSLQQRAARLGLELPGEPIPEPWRYIDEHGCVLRSELHPLHFKKRAQTIAGVVGSLDWKLLPPSPEVHLYLLGLLDLGTFLGIGSRTAMGMGAVAIEPWRKHGRSKQH